MTRAFLILGFWVGLFPVMSYGVDIESCSPQSEYIDWSGQVSKGVDVCVDWNPEFGYLQKCCAPTRQPSSLKRRKPQKYACSPERRYKSTYCDEMTITQKRYIDAASAGEVPNTLAFLEKEIKNQHLDQSYCTVNNGFLAWGRAVVGTDQNRIQLKNPARCTNFGTNELATLLEWLGREVGKEYTSSEYSGVRLVLGDLSAPRGGCLAGRNGRRGHSSHTSGLDADIAFLQAKDRKPSDIGFHKTFDAKTNWWLVKKMFSNPYVCVKVLFLDRKWIGKLARAAGADPYWQEVRSHIRHVKGHKNHFHVRVGTYPGAPGCPQLPADDDESDEDFVHDEDAS